MIIAGVLVLIGELIAIYGGIGGFAETARDPTAQTSLLPEIAIEAGRKVRASSIIKVRQDDEVPLRLIDDSSDILHLRGYEVGAMLEPGVPSMLHFVADKMCALQVRAPRGGNRVGRGRSLSSVID
jgi:hypothetical protein